MRPSLSKALGGATISRRYAAGRCADAQNAPRKHSDRTARRLVSTHSTSASGEIRSSSAITGLIKWPKLFALTPN